MCLNIRLWVCQEDVVEVEEEEGEEEEEVEEEEEDTTRDLRPRW